MKTTSSVLSVALLLAGYTAATVAPCPLVIVEPPPGTDITLCSNNCESSCSIFKTVPDYNACVGFSAEKAVKVEVLTDKTCAIYSDAYCGSEIVEVNGPGDAGFDSVYVQSVQCFQY